MLESLQWAQENWSIDRDRVILAGLSYGGLGTWEIGGRHPDTFAGLVPVSAHRATELADRLARVPSWSFAYRGDLVVDSDSSQDMQEAILAHGGKAQLTEFPGVGHDCWDRAVVESQLVDWMLNQRRSSAPVAPVALVE